MKMLDFRTDTVTQPTDEMRSAMADAVVGDDVLGEDPTVQRLEVLSAAMFGKEAGLFMCSGTMANQVAIMTLAQLGDEIIVGEDAHIHNLEAGGVAALSGVQMRALRAVGGKFSTADISKAIRPKGVQTATTRVLCLENSYDLNRGIPLPAEYQQEVSDIAHRHDIVVYLDGARIFNAALAFDVQLRDLCRPVDCLQFCLSKGLAAPVGSLIVGGKAFIERARAIRQRLGGGMRQAGHLAAAGIVALEKMLPRLEDDHDNARHLVNGLASIDDRLVDRETLLTNIVYIDFGAIGRQAAPIVEALSDRGIKIKQIGDDSCRMVTHWGLGRADVDMAVAAFKEVLS